MALVMPRNGMITAELVVRFGRPLETPVAALCRRRIEKSAGGEEVGGEMTGEVWDGVGGVYVEGKAPRENAGFRHGGCPYHISNYRH